MNEIIPLTKSIRVGSGSHILYVYADDEVYTENVASYVEMGLDMGQHVVYIDSEERYAAVCRRLAKSGRERLLQHITYVNNYDFYMMYGDFHFERVLEHLQHVIQPYVDSGQAIRLWGHVDWRGQADIAQQLHTYECRCDMAVGDLGILTVCAYDGRTIPAYVMTEMMRTHPLLMTDEQMVKSNLYDQPDARPIKFPTLSAQSRLESERDLYKEKLDFAHVISHEVRNPLTVIRAYASLVGDTMPPGSSQADKLAAIVDYCTVIDHEISDIIRTEHMLSSDALWVKKVIRPAGLILEVCEIMRAKARTQNLELDIDLQLSGEEALFGNSGGFKLILSNLVSNAIKYSYEGGRVVVRSYSSDGHLAIEVIDDGCGMSEEQQTKLFQKYEKLNDETSGQGIGLFMVKKLVDVFEGTIHVESELNRGSCFRIQLPFAQS